MHDRLSPEECRALAVIAEDGDAILFDLSVPRLSDLGLVEQTSGSFSLTDLGREVLALITNAGGAPEMSTPEEAHVADERASPDQDDRSAP